MAKILGVVGGKQVGKSSFCSFVKQLLEGKSVKELAFAKPLKDLAIQKFGIPAQGCYGSDEDKNYPIATWGKFFTVPVQNKYGKAHDTLLSAREFLQLLGTDIVRSGNIEYLTEQYRPILLEWLKEKIGQSTEAGEYNKKYDWDNTWVNAAIMDIKNTQADVITVSDVRFINELEALKSIGAKIVRLYRDSGAKHSIPHKSELEILQMNEDMFDYALESENNKNLTQLKMFVIKVLSSENLLMTGEVV